MKVCLQDDTLIIESENTDENEELKEWRNRMENKPKSERKWFEVHYYNSLQILEI